MLRPTTTGPITPIGRQCSNMIREFLLQALTFVLPPQCLLCHDGPEWRHGLCQRCWQSLPANHPACPRCALPMPRPLLCGTCQRRPPPFDRVIAPVRYQEPVDQMLCALKYREQLAFARTAAGLIVDRVNALAVPLPDLLIAVPMTARALRKRGLNQAAFIARRVGRALGIPVPLGWVFKTRQTERQSTLNARERQRNLAGAFHSKKRLDGKRVAVVDDILTTGSTVSELTTVLKTAGAAQVDVWVCARTPEVLPLHPTR